MFSIIDILRNWTWKPVEIAIAIATAVVVVVPMAYVIYCKKHHKKHSRIVVSVFLLIYLIIELIVLALVSSCRDTTQNTKLLHPVPFCKITGISRDINTGDVRGQQRENDGSSVSHESEQKCKHLR